MVELLAVTLSGAGATTIDWVTGVAALYVVLPACEAVTVTVPAPVKVSFPPD
jgi:hypothetical protein